MKGHSPVADFIIVCSGASDRQVKAVADSISAGMKKEGIYAIGTEGYNEGRWVLVDFGDVIVHIFHEDLRYFYNIESLWPYAEEVVTDINDRRQKIGRH